MLFTNAVSHYSQKKAAFLLIIIQGLLIRKEILRLRYNTVCSDGEKGFDEKLHEK